VFKELVENTSPLLYFSSPQTSILISLIRVCYTLQNNGKVMLVTEELHCTLFWACNCDIDAASVITESHLRKTSFAILIHILC
jgi:hypothetical protein